MSPLSLMCKVNCARGLWENLQDDFGRNPRLTSIEVAGRDESATSLVSAADSNTGWNSPAMRITSEDMADTRARVACGPASIFDLDQDERLCV